MGTTSQPAQPSRAVQTVQLTLRDSVRLKANPNESVYERPLTNRASHSRRQNSIRPLSGPSIRPPRMRSLIWSNLAKAVPGSAPTSSPLVVGDHPICPVPADGVENGFDSIIAST